VGLISGLLTLPLAPVRGVVWIADIVGQEAERELAARASPERALAELEAAHAAGEITDEQLEQRQAEVIDAALLRRAAS